MYKYNFINTLKFKEYNLQCTLTRKVEHTFAYDEILTMKFTYIKLKFNFFLNDIYFFHFYFDISI